jgi:tellurite resistance protein TehA-like permease
MFFTAIKPGDVSPPLWIVMGAAAISVNAGCVLIHGGDSTPYLHTVEPFLDAMTLALWTWATWWIPLLLFLGVWKHAVHRVPIRYSTMLWSIVFPLGMYAVATLRLSHVTGVAALASWSSAMTWVALAALAATFAGLLAASLSTAKVSTIKP